MLKQGIDVFDYTNEFYFDLCYHYESPNKRDIPMRDRASYFFVNINKCDSDCTYVGIDYNNAKFKCECRFRSFSDDTSSTGQNTITETTSKSNNLFPKKKTSSNIQVFKCLKNVFKNEYFKKCAGGIIILILTFCQIGCTILYFVRGIKILTKHTYSLFEAFKKYDKTTIQNEANPPKKTISNSKNNNKDIPSSQLDLKKDIILVNKMNKKTEKETINNKEDKKLYFSIKDMNENEDNQINKISTDEKLEKLMNIMKLNQ